MRIKVQCGCGCRFEFEVEPVNERMPVSLACPSCGADATALADAEIEQQLNVPGAPRIKSGGLRMAGETSAPSNPTPVAAAAAPPTDGAAPEFCSRHRQETAIETCRVCGKPICMKCMEVFGYLCSPFCRVQALDRKLNIPVCPHQKSVVADKEYLALKRGLAAAAAGIVLVVGVWVWYAWIAVMPKLVYSIKLSETSTNDSFYDLVGPGKLLSVAGGQVAVYDVAAGRTLWSASLEAPVTAGLGHHRGLDTVVASNEVWVLLPSRLAHFNFKTGARGENVELKGSALSFLHDEQSILVVSGADAEHQVLTRVALASGAVETAEKTAPPSSEKPAAGKAKKGPAPSIMSILADLSDHKASTKPEAFRTEFEPAGANAVEMEVKLLEPKIVYVDTMKAKGASVLDSSSLTASQGGEAADEMLNDAERQRTGGKRAEDMSRYQVTLHRWFAGDAGDWSGEVVGSPEIFPMKTVDLIITDKLLQVFDKNNKKLWESKLTYRIRDRKEREQHGVPPPCLEAGNTIYFADQGMLTAFETAGGNVRWRLTTVGITKFQFDNRGKLYVDTTAADPELIQYPDDIVQRRRAKPVLLKVEPATGQVLWTGERAASTCILSGKFVYEAGSAVASALLHLGQGEQYDFNIYRLDPADGRELWRYYQPKRAVGGAAEKTWILIQFPDELQVLRFYSL